ncbi:TetR/AcrR family transcriptional regulator [Nocardia sp. NPDC005366]|uniref:TetR/AcrR family transcriptional regulator n=1 Tax=Nocardia sp. NPDC005366 TaxID=3156878 RepID=UPI0033AE42FB
MGVRDDVLHAALECFAVDGYERTTITRIRERSGVSNGALFHHFPSKEAIADALYVESIRSVQDGYRQVLKRLPASPREAVGGVIGQHLSWVERNPLRARFLYTRGRLDWSTEAGKQVEAMNLDTGALYKDWLAPFIARGEVRRLPMAVLVAVMTGPAHAIAQQWLAGQIAGSPMEYIEHLVDAAVAAVSIDPGPRVARSPQSFTGRIHVQLLDEAGGVVAQGVSETALVGLDRDRLPSNTPE